LSRMSVMLPASIRLPSLRTSFSESNPVPASAIVSGLALALMVGLLAGILPALSASRLRIVDALRRI